MHGTYVGWAQTVQIALMASCELAGQFQFFLDWKWPKSCCLSNDVSSNVGSHVAPTSDEYRQYNTFETSLHKLSSYADQANANAELLVWYTIDNHLMLGPHWHGYIRKFVVLCRRTWYACQRSMLVRRAHSLNACLRLATAWSAWSWVGVRSLSHSSEGHGNLTCMNDLRRST